MNNSVIDTQERPETSKSRKRLLRFHPTTWGLWPYVEDQTTANQTEANSRGDERNQHSCRENRKDKE